MAGSTKSSVGAGTKMSYAVSGNSPYTYTDLSKVVSITPNNTIGEVEDVVLESDWGDYQGTIPEGECSMTLRFRSGDAGVKLIQAWALTPTTVHWKITYPDGSYEIFDGFVKSQSKTFENKTLIDLEVSIRVKTKPVYTEYTPTP
jgi:hypothetical protein